MFGVGWLAGQCSCMLGVRLLAGCEMNRTEFLDVWGWMVGRTVFLYVGGWVVGRM